VRPDAPGLSAAVRIEGELAWSGAGGLADLEHRVPCTPASVFDVASVSKSVTAAAIAVLAAADELDLDAPLRELLPELGPAFDGATVRQLVHHTAGVEDDTGLLALAGWREPYDAGPDDALALLLRQEHLRFAPGTGHLYSNGNYVLLAEVVRRVGGAELPAWAREHLFEPLGLAATSFADGSRRIVENRAFPYEEGPEGGWLRAPLGRRYGPGGLLTTMAELTAWGEELRTGATLGDEVIRTIRTTGRVGSRPIDYAFGLVHGSEDGREVWRHSGSDPGVQSALAIYPESGLVVAVASNGGSGPSAFELARDLARLFLGPGEAPAPVGRPGMRFISAEQTRPPESEGVTVDPDVLASYAGTYRMEDGLVLSLGVDGTRLLLGFGEEPSIELFPIEGGRFVLASVGFEFAFEPEANRLTLRIPAEDRTDRGTRVVVAPLDEAAAAGLVGTYTSRELGASYGVELEAGELRLVHPCHGRMRLTPSLPDVYTLGGRALSRLTFVRDDQGRVHGFDLEAFSWNAASRFERAAAQGSKR